MTAEIIPLRDERLVSALDYARRGWFVAPLHTMESGACTCGFRDCISPAKHPRLGRGYQPSRDPKVVTDWWKKYPGSNVAVFTGPSSLVVLDVDPRNGGEESFAELEKQFGELPRTPWSHTGGGGWHVFFWKPPHVDDVRTCELAPGVELKGRSGYIVAPSSIHLSGRVYAWDSDRDLEVPLAEAPTWLLGLSRAPGRRQGDPNPDGPLAGLLGQAFAAAGMYGRPLGPTKNAVACPWSDEHTAGEDYDSSTVVFAPTLGHRFGWFHCSHAHCSSRSMDDVLEALPKAAVEAARAKMGIAAAVPVGWLEPIDFDIGEVDDRVPIEIEEPGPDEWQKSLRLDAKGQLAKEPGNAALMLGNLPEWQGSVAYDDFRDRYIWVKDAPPGISGIARPRAGQEFQDFHIVYCQTWLAKRVSLVVGSDMVEQGLTAAAHMRTINPVKEYLTGLTWDGVPRLGAASSLYFKTRTKTANQTFTWFLISAVARIFDPGCQADHMLILEGLQATRKSTALKILGDPWVLESLPTLRDITRCQEAIQGKWLCVMNELDAMRGIDAARVKDFLTMRCDTYRGAYKRFHTDRSRQCVFAGTTNESTYLRDWTGARRFWPIKLGAVVNTKALERDRDQLWAESVNRYRMGDKWWPEWFGDGDSGFVAALTEVQDERQDYDELETKVAAWVRTAAEGFALGDVLSHLGVPPDRWDRRLQSRVGAALGRLNYEPRRIRAHPGDIARTRRYFKAESALRAREPGEEG